GLARLERQALSFERVGGDGLVQIRVSLGRQCEQDDGGVVVRILVAEEAFARHHTRWWREADARARWISRLARGRRCHAAHEQDKETGNHLVIVPRSSGRRYGCRDAQSQLAILRCPVSTYDELAIVPRRGWRYAPKRKVDPPALRQERRRARQDAVDAVEGQTRLTAEHDGIAGGEVHDTGRIAAFRSAYSKETGVAERKRDDGRRKIALVTILMQSHLRCGMIIVNETTFGGMGIA